MTFCRDLFSPYSKDGLRDLYLAPDGVCLIKAPPEYRSNFCLRFTGWPNDRSEAQCFQFWSEFGRVTGFNFAREDNARPKGFGFVQYENSHMCNKAIGMTDQINLEGGKWRLWVEHSDREFCMDDTVPAAKYQLNNYGPGPRVNVKGDMAQMNPKDTVVMCPWESYPARYDMDLKYRGITLVRPEVRGSHHTRDPTCDPASRYGRGSMQRNMSRAVSRPRDSPRDGGESRSSGNASHRYQRSRGAPIERDDRFRNRDDDPAGDDDADRRSQHF